MAMAFGLKGLRPAKLFVREVGDGCQTFCLVKVGDGNGLWP